MKLNELIEGTAQLDDLIDDAMFIREIPQKHFKKIRKAVISATKDINTLTKINIVNIIDDLDIDDDSWANPDDDDEAGSDYDWNELAIKEGVTLYERAGRVRGSGLAFAGKIALAGLTVGMAVDAFKKYKRNKRTTTTFYAKDTQERTLYKDIVNTLMQTGKFKKVKEQYIDGGYLWVLQKTR
jgi:hypothetical protein